MKELSISSDERTQFKYAMCVLTFLTAGAVKGEALTFLLLTIILVGAVRFLNNRDRIANRDILSMIAALVVCSIIYDVVLGVLRRVFGEKILEDDTVNRAVLAVLIIVDIIGWFVYSQSKNLVNNAEANVTAESSTKVAEDFVSETTESTADEATITDEAANDIVAEPAGTQDSETAMTCPKCGNVLDAAAIFCNRCGTKVR